MPSSPAALDPRDADERPALILANLGTPAEPRPRAVRSFLREFLSDRRVVETHPLLWRPVLERHHPAGASPGLGCEVRHRLASG